MAPADPIRMGATRPRTVRQMLTKLRRKLEHVIGTAQLEYIDRVHHVGKGHDLHRLRDGPCGEYDAGVHRIRSVGHQKSGPVHASPPQRFYGVDFTGDDRKSGIVHSYRAIGIRLDDIRRDSDVLQPPNQTLGDRIVLADDHMTRDVTRDVLQSPHPTAGCG